MKVIDDYFDVVRLEHHGDQTTGYHCIKIDGLQAGTYSLTYLSGKTHVFHTIEVIKGTVWASSDNFILKDNCLIERLNNTMTARFSGVEIEDLSTEEDEASHVVRV